MLHNKMRVVKKSKCDTKHCRLYSWYLGWHILLFEEIFLLSLKLGSDISPLFNFLSNPLKCQLCPGIISFHPVDLNKVSIMKSRMVCDIRYFFSRRQNWVSSLNFLLAFLLHLLTHHRDGLYVFISVSLVVQYFIHFYFHILLPTLLRLITGV